MQAFAWLPIEKELAVTRPAILAIFGGIVVFAAIILNVLLGNIEEEKLSVQQTPPKNAGQLPSPEEEKLSVRKSPPTTARQLPHRSKTLPPQKGLTLNPGHSQKQQAYEPSFDTIRINRDGDAVIVGRAAPGAKVEILDDEIIIGKVVADKRGEWVFVPSSPLPPGSRQFSLMMIDGAGKKVSSKEPVIMIIPEKGKDIAGRPTLEPTQPLVIKIPTEDTGSLEVLQKTRPVIAGKSVIEFVVDAIDYNAFGKLRISGKALQRALLQLYLNNKFIGRTRADDRGIWNLSPKEPVAPGVYTLRADNVDTAGKVLGRREVIFARSVPLTGVKPGSLIVVEPGNSLWRIARRTYGTGFKYTVIYEANREQIQNADLIFPGQVFTLPSTN